MLTKIYTKTGDGGETSLVGGVRVKKDSARLESYGTVDELSSHLGLLAAMMSEEEKLEPYAAEIERIQCNLFNVCTYLATDTTQTPVYPSAQLDPAEIQHLEEEIDKCNASLPTLKSFILPGGSIIASQCHVCRTVCRRAERRIVTVAEGASDFDATMLKYVNRLSDYLFVLARQINITLQKNEKTWSKPCR